MAPPRLHANLLFYGFDEGTWSDPPMARAEGLKRPDGERLEVAGSGSEQARAESVVPLENIKAVWGEARGCDPCDAGSPASAAAPALAAVAEPSTDEGSDLKGSESDSLPDSSIEGYLSSPLSEAPPPPLAYMQLDQAAAVYSPYLQPDGLMALQGFGVPSEPVSAPFPYEEYAATAAAGVPSIGSYAHLSGLCSRCCFHPKGRCANGYACQFCHFDHDKRPRNGKKKRPSAA